MTRTDARTRRDHDTTRSPRSVGTPLLAIALAAVMSCHPAVKPTTTPAVAVAAAPSAAPAPCSDLGGLSGMAPINATSFLVVHDAKGASAQPRLSRLAVVGNGYRCEEVRVADWKDAGGTASDLESACALPGRPGEYLVAESGTWKSQYGRTFHLRLAGTTADVVGVYKLPVVVDQQQDGDDFEGLACVARSDGTFLLLLGERGGSALYPDGVLRPGRFDPRAASLQWSAAAEGIRVAAPGTWPSGLRHRDISDLHVDAQNVLWVSAAADGGDNGPFRSVIYAAGQVDADANSPLIASAPQIAWVLDGLKIEALSSAPLSVGGSVMSVGTDDENFGGIWRPLFSASSPQP